MDLGQLAETQASSLSDQVKGDVLNGLWRKFKVLREDVVRMSNAVFSGSSSACFGSLKTSGCPSYCVPGRTLFLFNVYCLLRAGSFPQ